MGGNVNPLSANRTKWSNTLKICRQQPKNYLSVFDHFVGLALTRLTLTRKILERRRSLFIVSSKHSLYTNLDALKVNSEYITAYWDVLRVV